MDTATPATGLTSAYLWSGTLVLHVYYGFAVMGIFRKAGVEAWPAWVPVFDVWRLLEQGGHRG